MYFENKKFVVLFELPEMNLLLIWFYEKLGH